MKERSGMPYDVVAFSTDERAMMLSLEAEGAFHRLLRHAWVNGSIPENMTELSQICRTSDLRIMKRIWKEVGPMWERSEKMLGRRINLKQESERVFLSERSVKASLSARKRWNTKENKDANALPTQCEGNATSHDGRNAPLPSPPLSLLKDSPLVPHIDQKPAIAPENGSGVRERFAVFWKTYPRKIGKAAAFKSWRRIKPDKALTQQILEKVEEAKTSAQWRKDNGQFIPHPATWLNQGRWDDEVKTDSRPQSVHDFL